MWKMYKYVIETLKDCNNKYVIVTVTTTLMSMRFHSPSNADIKSNVYILYVKSLLALTFTVLYL